MEFPGAVYVFGTISAASFALFIIKLGVFLREADEDKLRRIMVKRAIISSGDFSGTKIEVEGYFRDVKRKLYSLLAFWEVSIFSVFFLGMFLKESESFIVYRATHSLLVSNSIAVIFLFVIFIFITLPLGFVRFMVKKSNQYRIERLEELR